jgi:hypothetical protein
MRVDISNLVAVANKRGNGKSQERVKEVAARNRWEVQFPDISQPGELYIVRMLFSDVYDLRME